MDEPVSKLILQRTIDIWNGNSIMNPKLFLKLKEETQGTFTRITVGSMDESLKTKIIFMESFDTKFNLFEPISKEDCLVKAYNRLLNAVLLSGLNQEFERWDKGIIEMDKNYQVTIHQFETRRIE